MFSFTIHTPQFLQDVRQGSPELLRLGADCLMDLRGGFPFLEVDLHALAQKFAHSQRRIDLGMYFLNGAFMRHRSLLENSECSPEVFSRICGPSEVLGHSRSARGYLMPLAYSSLKC
jgi:hypothetical protein